MNPDDHQLLEQTRKANKTLSLFAFALQEEAPLSVRHQHEISDVLEALTEAIRERAIRQHSQADAEPVAIEGDVTTSETNNRPTSLHPDEE